MLKVVEVEDTGGVPLSDLFRCGCKGTTEGVDGLPFMSSPWFRFGIEDDVVCGLKNVEMACKIDILRTLLISAAQPTRFTHLLR